MKNHYIKEESLVKKAMTLLVKNLGPVETLRFLSLSKNRSLVDSVKRHQEWQKNLNTEEFMTEIFGRQNNSSK